jgi:hypothetical protein
MIRLDAFQARGGAYMKLPQNGTVSFPIRLAAFQARRRSYETFQKLELVLPRATLHCVGWVEPVPGFVGFRCTQPNLHFAAVIANCETQQRLISEPSPKSFFLY